MKLWPFYLRPNLISTLTSLNVNNFPPGDLFQKFQKFRNRKTLKFGNFRRKKWKFGGANTREHKRVLPSQSKTTDLISERMTTPSFSDSTSTAFENSNFKFSPSKNTFVLFCPQLSQSHKPKPRYCVVSLHHFFDFMSLVFQNFQY